MAVVILLPGVELADIAAVVAPAVREALAAELARIDVPTSTRATPSDVQQGGASTTTYGGSLS